MPWIIAGLFLLGYETLALATEHKTLSRMVWEANYKWPFLSSVVCLIVGGLLVHMFWIPAGCEPLKGF